MSKANQDSPKEEPTKSENQPQQPQSQQPQDQPQTNQPQQKKSKTLPIIAVGCVILSCLTVAVGFAVWWFAFREGGNSTVTRTQLKLETSKGKQAASKNLGVNGGKVVVDDSSSPLDGSQIQVGEGDLDEKEEISIGYKEIDSQDIPEDMALLSDVVVLTKTNEDKVFNKPVAVTIPYNEDDVEYGDFISVYEIVDDEGTIEETTVVDKNEDDGEITFMVTHFSDFVVLELLMDLNMMMEQSMDSGFYTPHDGWYITNWGSYTTDGGNCMGMSMMAKWYYANKKNDDGRYYKRFIEGKETEEKDDVIAQELAARAQMAMGDRWAELDKDIWRFGHFAYYDQTEHGKAILTDLMVTGQPQLVALYTVYTETKADGTKQHKLAEGGHMVMVTKFDGEYFHIYDPNYPYRPGEETHLRKVKFSFDKGFEKYGSQQNAGTKVRGYNTIAHIGTNLVTENKTLSSLYSKAVAGFPDDEFPEITFDTPDDGGTVTEKSVVVSGTVEGGEYEEKAGKKFAHWYYMDEDGGAGYVRGEIDEDGYFDQELPLVPGENTINLLAAGEKPTDEWAGFATIDINSEMKPADMVVTLTWDRNQSDIDLHVTDPNDEHVYYMFMTASNGAELDFDNRYGYGPEHYTVSEEEGDEMPYGDYKIQVNYYADHDDNYDADQAIPWDVNVRWVSSIDAETEEKNWEERSFSGVLTSAGQFQDVWTLEIEDPEEVEREVENNPDVDWEDLAN